MKRDLTIFLGAVVLLIIIIMTRCASILTAQPVPTPTVAITPTSTPTPTPLPRYKDTITPAPAKQEFVPNKDFIPFPKNEVFVDCN